MDYIDAATSGTLSPHVLPVVDLQRMLKHIADTLPPMLHLPISLEETLHFYRYLCTHVLTLSTPHVTIVTISHLVEKVPLQELLSATELSVRLV